MENNIVVKRTTREKNREIRHAMYSENAKLALGTISKGCEIYGLCKGQFSIINIIREVLRQVGKSDVIISTWTAAGYDIKKTFKLKEDGYINKISFILDRSAKTKVGGDNFKVFEEYFKNEIFITNCHAKFILIKNDDWNICIRTSMNLNENKRLENFEISDCKVLYNYMHSIASDIISEEYNNKSLDSLGRNEKYKKIDRNTEKINYGDIKLF